MSNLKSLKNIIENYSEQLKYLSSSEIENLQALLEDIKDRPKNIWDLETKDRETYYRLCGNGCVCSDFFSSITDKDIRDMGNAFLTKEEAEFERERRKIEAVMRRYARPFKHEEDNWYIECSHASKHIGIDALCEYDCGIIYFESEEIAQMVVDEIGRDRLIKYWFNVNS